MVTHALTAESGEVDLLIRTGGEKRLSDFLLWESAYAELCLHRSHVAGLRCRPIWMPPSSEFNHRERRFGAVPAAQSNPRMRSGKMRNDRSGSSCTPTARSLRVKFILPALTEATDPYWRPIKYSLFPPLGLATLAAYLSPR